MRINILQGSEHIHFQETIKNEYFTRNNKKNVDQVIRGAPHTHFRRSTEDYPFRPTFFGSIDKYLNLIQLINVLDARKLQKSNTLVINQMSRM